MQRVQRSVGQAGDLGQSVNAFIAAGRALVDGRITRSDGICISRAIRVAATRALRLRQHIQNAPDQSHCIQAVARRLLLVAAVLALAGVLTVTLTAGFLTAAFRALG